MRIPFRKRNAVDRPKNLVLYNLERVTRYVKDWCNNEGDVRFTSYGTSYDEIMSTLDFIGKEMERNYNVDARQECPHCDAVLEGWLAHNQLMKHMVSAHPEICEAQRKLILRWCEAAIPVMEQEMERSLEEIERLIED